MFRTSKQGPDLKHQSPSLSKYPDERVTPVTTGNSGEKRRRGRDLLEEERMLNGKLSTRENDRSFGEDRP